MIRRFNLENTPYHTISVTHSRAPILTRGETANTLVDAINHEREVGHAYVLAYAILPDHMHLLLVPRDPFDVSKVMHNLKSYSAKAINKALSRTGAVWQQSFYDRVIRDEQQLATTIDYIHHNPVVAHLSLQPEEYSWSSAYPMATTDVETFMGE